MPNAKKNASKKATAEKIEASELTQNQRLRIIQEGIRTGTYPTRQHVIRDLQSAQSLLNIMLENPEIIDLACKALEKSILNCPIHDAD